MSVAAKRHEKVRNETVMVGLIMFGEGVEIESKI